MDFERKVGFVCLSTLSLFEITKFISKLEKKKLDTQKKKLEEKTDHLKELNDELDKKVEAKE